MSALSVDAPPFAGKVVAPGGASTMCTASVGCPPPYCHCVSVQDGDPVPRVALQARALPDASDGCFPPLPPLCVQKGEEPPGAAHQVLAWVGGAVWPGGRLSRCDALPLRHARVPTGEDGLERRGGGRGGRGGKLAWGGEKRGV